MSYLNRKSIGVGKILSNPTSYGLKGLFILLHSSEQLSNNQLAGPLPLTGRACETGLFKRVMEKDVLDKDTNEFKI